MDPQRLKRLMDLWFAETKNLPQGTKLAPFYEMDPMMAYQALGSIPGGQTSPMALRFLQLGQAMQPQPDQMILELIAALLNTKSDTYRSGSRPLERNIQIPQGYQPTTKY